ncbi:MAG: UDP-N-acetylenolpyruvoylglucosamine reductase [Isosphaeraceae bacterium]|jgi:UDP-N-acetylmuramate dehydrogenase|nr:MAG: UDP-N-acetylenolpyruvoylglucosamine reductase [Isosphaeraceae bacterium]
MGPFDDLSDFVRPSVPLAPLTWFRLGGPAEYLARPRTTEHLATVLARCLQSGIPFRILGSGTNVLVRDEGVRGLVVHLESPAFSDVRIEGTSVQAGAAVPVTALISQTARAGLAGLELLTGIPGTVGGALRGNAGGREGSIGRYVQSVEVLDDAGRVVVREKDEIHFGPHESDLDEPVILGCSLSLEPDHPEAVVRRMRRIWIVKKENQPYGHQSSGYIFRDPAPDVSARTLIDQAGLKGLRLGGAEVSDRHSGYMIAHPGATAADVLGLMELVRQRVKDHSGYDLEPQIQVW